MTKVLSMRLQQGQMDRLKRLARRMGRTPSEISALLVEEGLCETEFAFVEFRDSSVGRQAYIKGSRLAVWEVLATARSLDMDVERTAEHLRWAPHRVQAAINYARAFPDKVETAIADDDATDFTSLQRLLPQIERFVIQPEAALAEP